MTLGSITCYSPFLAATRLKETIVSRQIFFKWEENLPDKMWNDPTLLRRQIFFLGELRMLKMSPAVDVLQDTEQTFKCNDGK